MKKNKMFLAGLALLTLVLGLTGCPTGGPDNKYTVTFNANGGTPATKAVGVEKEQTVVFPDAPVYGGLVFQGWFTGTGFNNNWGTRFTQQTPVTGDITVFARWGTTETLAAYTVTYNANGETVSPASAEVEEGTVLASLPDPGAPSSGASVFWGWYTADGTSGGDWGTRFMAGTAVDADMTVYARWGTGAPTEYIVTFDAQGGSTPHAKRVNSGDKLGNGLPDSAKKGNNFGGWYTAANGGGTEFTGATPVTGDMMVYAKWTVVSAGKTVTFTGIGGMASQIPSTHVLIGLSADQQSMAAGALIPVSSMTGNSITVELKTFDMTAMALTGPWTGTGSYYIVVFESDGTLSKNIEDYASPLAYTDKIDFTGANTTVGQDAFDGGGTEEPKPGPGDGVAKTLTFKGMEISDTDEEMPDTDEEMPSTHILVGIFSDWSSSSSMKDLTAGAFIPTITDPLTVELKTPILSPSPALAGNWTGTGRYYIAVIAVLTSDGTLSANVEDYLPLMVTKSVIEFKAKDTTVTVDDFEFFKFGGDGGDEPSRPDDKER